MTEVILFVFGAIIGSFLNVAALRLRSGRSLGGRSACAHCGTKLRWFELVPVLSYLVLGGRCRTCRARISWRYPGVEVLTGLMFATVFDFRFSILQNALILAIFSLYVVILVYDLRHKIIPDAPALAAAALAAAAALLAAPHSLLDWLAGPVLFLFFALLWAGSRGRAMGFGDAKLSLSIGFLLGAAQGFSAVILAFWIGAAAGLFLIAFGRTYPLLRGGRRITMKSEVPFAPFLILGAWLAFIFHPDLLHVSLF